jgi:ribosomal-protein-alanine N-acetyltransferase
MSTVLQRLTIELMREEHIPQIHGIEVRSYACPWSENSFRAELSNRMSHYIVARSANEIVGYAGQWIVVDEAHITTLAVAPEHRRKRYGELLLTELLTYAVERGLSRITLEVRLSNEAAQSLYHKYGFETVAIRRAYYPDREDACVMWLTGLSAPDYQQMLAAKRRECRALARVGD